MISHIAKLSTLELAIDLANTAHNGQVDRAGKPYILHPIRVMSACETTSQMIVAILHDVSEDMPAMIKDVEELLENFIDLVIAIRLLTRGKETYESYIYKLAVNEIATYVKIKDLEDNMQLNRLPSVHKRDIDRMVKYTKALGYLKGVQSWRQHQN